MISEEITILIKLRTIITARRELNLQLLTFKMQMIREKARTLELCGQQRESHRQNRGKDGPQLANEEVAVPFVSYSCYQNGPSL